MLHGVSKRGLLLLVLWMLLSVPTGVRRGKPVQITRVRDPNKIVYRSPEPILNGFGSCFCNKSVCRLKSGFFVVYLCPLICEHTCLIAECHGNLGAKISWNPLGHTEPVTGLLYLLPLLTYSLHRAESFLRS